MPKKKTILLAPLHWGLGHATRCIPIIRALLAHNFDVLLASDGGALLLLQKEFPQLESVHLPSYSIQYPKNGRFFKWKMLLNLPQIQKAISSEKKIVDQLVKEGKIHGIVSDNRPGVYHVAIPSVYISHQLRVLSGSTTFFSSKIHQKIIKKFDACWVPDVADGKWNLSGKLGHLKRELFPITYLGILSRMEKSDVVASIGILAILSGPEPQRTFLEEKLKNTLKNSNKNVAIVRGIVEKEQKWEEFENIKMVNFLDSKALEETINRSEIVISRSGYTSIMDLAVLQKKVFFIPTPGQYEQEYLAKRFKKLGVAPWCKQEEFTLKKLENLETFAGFSRVPREGVDFSKLFSLFERK